MAPYQPFDMSNPRLDTPMMMNQDDMLAIEADRPSYPALMNGINNVTTSCMTPYGNTGCGVSRWGIQNPIDFCLKVKCSKWFFGICWNLIMASLKNLDQFLENTLFLALTSSKSTKNKNCTFCEKKIQNFLSRHVSKSDVESQNLAFAKTMPSFHLKKY